MASGTSKSFLSFVRSWSHLVECAVVALALFSCKGGLQSKADETSKQELLALENRWLQVEGDPVAVEPILAADFLHVVPGAIITKDQHLRFLREHPPTGPQPDKHLEDLHVRVYGKAGVVNGVVVKKTEQGERKTLFTDVFAFRDGRWQAVSAQELPAATP